MNLISVELAKSVTDSVKYKNVLVLNRQKEAKTEEYTGLEGRILLVGDYVFYANAQEVRFAVDLEGMSMYACPMKALQSSVLLSEALKEIENNPNYKSGTKAAQDAYTYLFETKLPKCKVDVRRNKVESDNVYSFGSNGFRLGTVAIGPRGGVKSDLFDVQPIIGKVLETFERVPRTMMEYTAKAINKEYSEAFCTVLNAVIEGNRIPEKVGNIVVELVQTGSANPNGCSPFDVYLKNGNNSVMRIPVSKGNVKTRRAFEVKVANVFIPGAATIEVKMTPGKDQ